MVEMPPINTMFVYLNRTGHAHTWRKDATITNTDTNNSTNNTPFTAETLLGCASSDFTVDVTIGTHTFQLIVDTGSTTLAVAGSGCVIANTPNGTPTGQCPVTPLYDERTGTNENESAGNVYGDGSGFEGNVYTDQVTVHGTDTVDMAFVAIDEAFGGFFAPTSCLDSDTSTDDSSSNSNVYTNQGILGMGYPALEDQGTDGWWTVYRKSNPAIPDIFAFQLCSEYGKMYIGGYDANDSDGSEPQYTPIITQSYYSVQLNDVMVGTASTGISTTAIADTGTSLFVLPEPEYTTFVQTLTANATFAALNFPSDFFTSATQTCVTFSGTTAQLNAMLPPMHIELAGTTGSTSITLSMNAISSYILETPVRTSDGSVVLYYCPGIENSGPIDSNVPSSAYIIMGYSVLNNFITLFDRGNTSIGFVPSTSCSTSSMVSSSSHSSSGSSHIASYAVGIAVGVGGFLLLIMLFYWCIRKRQHRSMYSTEGFRLGTPTTQATLSGYVAAPLGSIPPGTQRGDWQIFYSHRGQTPYYYNVRSQQSIWNAPLEFQ